MQRSKNNVPENLVDKVWVGKRLQAARERRGHPDLKKFMLETGLTGLKENEKGRQFAGWETLVRVAAHLKVPTWQLVREIEGIPASVADLKVDPLDLAVYEKLAAILDQGSDDQIKTVKVLIDAVVKAATTNTQNQEVETPGTTAGDGDPSRVRYGRRTRRIKDDSASENH